MSLFSKIFAAGALGLAGTLIVRANQEPAPPEPEQLPMPRVVSEVKPAKSGVTARGLGNGTGNTIIVENGGGRSTTIISDSRASVGGKTIIVDGKVLVAEGGRAARAEKCGERWAGKFYSPLHGCTLYYDLDSLKWYRFDKASRTYQAVDLARVLDDDDE